MFTVRLSDDAARQLRDLAEDRGLAKRYKAVMKALRLLAADPNYPSLNTHPWRGQSCPHGDTMFESYAENRTPGAYRIFFCFPPDERAVILVLSIVPHP